MGFLHFNCYGLCRISVSICSHPRRADYDSPGVHGCQSVIVGDRNTSLSIDVLGR